MIHRLTGKTGSALRHLFSVIEDIVLPVQAQNLQFDNLTAGRTVRNIPRCAACKARTLIGGFCAVTIGVNGTVQRTGGGGCRSVVVVCRTKRAVAPIHIHGCFIEIIGGGDLSHCRKGIVIAGIKLEYLSVAAVFHHFGGHSATGAPTERGFGAATALAVAGRPTGRQRTYCFALKVGFVKHITGNICRQLRYRHFFRNLLNDQLAIFHCHLHTLQISSKITLFHIGLQRCCIGSYTAGICDLDLRAVGQGFHLHSYICRQLQVADSGCTGQYDAIGNSTVHAAAGNGAAGKISFAGILHIDAAAGCTFTILDRAAVHIKLTHIEPHATAVAGTFAVLHCTTVHI